MGQVLVVADSPTRARTLASVIPTQRADVVICSEPDSVGQMASQQHPGVCIVDLAATDVRTAVLTEVAERSPDTVTVALVDGPAHDQVFQLEDAGASVLIPRSASVRYLSSTVMKLLGDSTRDLRRSPVVRDSRHGTAGPDLDDDVQKAVARSRLFDLLSTDQANEVLTPAEERSFPQGAHLQKQDQRSKRLVLLISGQAQQFHLTRDGREFVLSVLGPGDPVGLPSLLSDAPALTSVSTLQSTRALVWPTDPLRMLRRTSPALIGALAYRAGILLHQRTWVTIELAVSEPAERVARRILSLAERFGETVEDGVRVPLPLTQDGLAAWAGISRKTLGRQLAGLRDEGLIRTGRCEIDVLDLEGLRT